MKPKSLQTQSEKKEKENRQISLDWITKPAVYTASRSSNHTYCGDLSLRSVALRLTEKGKLTAARRL